MGIEHVAMYVNDLEGARKFLRHILMRNRMTCIIIKQRISNLTF